MMTSRTRRSFETVLAVVAVGVLAACGVPAESEPRALPAEAAGALTSPTPAETDSTATRFMALWFVADGQLVQVDRATDTARTPQEKIWALEAGPTQPELNAGMRTAVASVVPDVPLVETAETAQVPVDLPEDQVAVVLSEEFDSLPSQEQLLALGQVVTTLSDSQINSVLFVDSSGVSVGVPLPDGRLANRPVTTLDYASLRG